jgi:hypothetical protein
MYYQINISKNGQHYFATAEHSVTDFAKANELYKDLVQKFPTIAGFKTEMRRYETVGKLIARNFEVQE